MSALEPGHPRRQAIRRLACVAKVSATAASVFDLYRFTRAGSSAPITSQQLPNGRTSRPTVKNWRPREDSNLEPTA